MTIPVGDERNQKIALDIMEQSKQGLLMWENIRAIEMQWNIAPTEYLPKPAAQAIALAYHTDQYINDAELQKIRSRYSDRAVRIASLLRSPLLKLMSMGVNTARIDINDDGVVESAEALIYMLRNLKPRYEPILKRHGIKHPIDTDDYDPQDLQRIKDIASKVKSKMGIDGWVGLTIDLASTLGIDEIKDTFCRRFEREFIEAGKESFAKGGLCLGYTEPRTKSIDGEPELTSSEAFEVCRNPDETYGSCTEMTYKVIGASKVAKIPCDIKAIATENHLFPSYNGISLDPSKIGEIGWSRETDALASYFYSKSAKDSSNTVYGRIAHLLAPKLYLDWHAIDKLFYEISRTHKSTNKIPDELIENFLDEFDNRISHIPDSILPFNHLGKAISKLPQEARIEMAFAILKRWPENPYALIPLLENTPPYSEDSEEMDKIVQRLKRLSASRGFADTFLAWKASRAGYSGKALKYAEKAIEDNDQSAIALQEIARNALLRGKYDKAEEYTRRSIAIAPNLAMNHYRLALIAMREGDLEEAKVEAEKERTVFSGNRSVIQLSANLAYLRGQPKEAINILWQHGVIHNLSYGPMLAVAYRQMGKFKEAMEIFKEVLEIAPEKSRIYEDLSTVSLNAYDLKRAKEYLSRTDRADEWNVQHMRISLAENDIVEAEKQLKRIKKSISDDDKIKFFEAQLQFAKGNFSEAKVKLEAIAKKRPNAFLTKIPKIEIAEGRLRQAREKYEKLLSEFPDVFVVKTVEPELLLREEKYDVALTSADRILRMSPLNLPALRAKGYALVELGKPRQAFGIGYKLATRFPKQPDGMRIMARALLKMGSPTEAAKLIPKIKAVEIYDPISWPLMSTQAIEGDIHKARSAK